MTRRRALLVALIAVAILAAVALFKHPAESRPDPQVSDISGLTVTLGATGAEVGWADVRFATEPGLALVYSELYPISIDPAP